MFEERTFGGGGYLLSVKLGARTQREEKTSCVLKALPHRTGLSRI